MFFHYYGNDSLYLPPCWFSKAKEIIFTTTFIYLKQPFWIYWISGFLKWMLLQIFVVCSLLSPCVHWPGKINFYISYILFCYIKSHSVSIHVLYVCASLPAADSHNIFDCEFICLSAPRSNTATFQYLSMFVCFALCSHYSNDLQWPRHSCKWLSIWGQ